MDIGIQPAKVVTFGVNSYVQGAPVFTGAYEYTPSAEQQIIEIKGEKAVENIVIKPVPSNYGLISWNGSTLTIS